MFMAGQFIQNVDAGHTLHTPQTSLYFHDHVEDPG